MSQAFLREDAEGEMPRRDYALPPRDDPDFDRAAARALLEAARVSETQLAERATGYLWGEPRLRGFVEEMRAEAEAAGDDRLEQVARRFLGGTPRRRCSPATRALPDGGARAGFSPATRRAAQRLSVSTSPLPAF